MNDDRQLKIHFNNGDKLIVTFPPKLKGSTAAVMEAMKKVMETEKLVIEAEGKLVIIPWSSMKQLELTPTPAALPFGAIQGARISQETTA